MQCLLGHERFPPCAHSHRRPRHRLPKAAQAAPLLASGIAATLSTPLDREKLPIYSQSDIEILVQQVFSELERQIGITRKSLTATYREAHGHVQDLVSRWY
uniref:Uncharacterized protein n=1 Tax=Moniliophthora roreri TaxID=221103 RepID=A0A0W0EVB3_MONRR